jgi:hypothetical protein
MKKIFAAVLLTALCSTPMLAETMPNPSGDVVLTVSGAIQNENSDNGVTLDMDMLKALPPQRFTTTTIWTEGNVEFTGISLKALLDHVGFSGTKIEAIASNDYKIEIPVTDVTGTAPVVAYLMNGEEMSSRGKGPLWIVYPYDSDAKFRTEVIYSRSIWQLDRIISVK